MNIQTKAKQIIKHFENVLDVHQEEIIEPSSWWDENMIMLEEDPETPLELRLYCEWMPFKERKHNDWHFFAPHHVFRRPEDSDYLIALTPLKILTYSCLQKKWAVVSRTDGPGHSANCFSDIAVHL